MRIFLRSGLAGLSLFLYTNALAQSETAAHPPAMASSPSITLPKRGLSMQEVETQFGAPKQEIPSVGIPPITRWVYPDFTVYFEFSYVIHAVPNNIRAQR